MLIGRAGCCARMKADAARRAAVDRSTGDARAEQSVQQARSHRRQSVQAMMPLRSTATAAISGDQRCAGASSSEWPFVRARDAPAPGLVAPSRGRDEMFTTVAAEGTSTSRWPLLRVVLSAAGALMYAEGHELPLRSDERGSGQVLAARAQSETTPGACVGCSVKSAPTDRRRSRPLSGSALQCVRAVGAPLYGTATGRCEPSGHANELQQK